MGIPKITLYDLEIEEMKFPLVKQIEKLVCVICLVGSHWYKISLMGSSSVIGVNYFFLSNVGSFSIVHHMVTVKRLVQLTARTGLLNF